jgi:hypothetical protein
MADLIRAGLASATTEHLESRQADGYRTPEDHGGGDGSAGEGLRARKPPLADSLRPARSCLQLCDQGRGPWPGLRDQRCKYESWKID